MKLKEWTPVIVFFFVGVAGLMTAFVVSVRFLTPAESQTAEPLEVPEPPPPVPENVETVPPEKSASAPEVELVPVESGTKVEVARHLEGIIEEYNYDPKGKRDPFMPFTSPRGGGFDGGPVVGPIFPLQRFDLDQLRLVGIIWSVKNPKAMFEDPAGKNYIVSENERVGRNNGYIAAIREGEVVIVESSVVSGRMNYQSKVLRLQKEAKE